MGVVQGKKGRQNVMSTTPSGGLTLTSDAQATRNCLRGHGPMKLLEGLWVVAQVHRNDDQARSLAYTGKAAAALMYECEVCRTLELESESPI